MAQNLNLSTAKEYPDGTRVKDTVWQERGNLQPNKFLFRLWVLSRGLFGHVAMNKEIIKRT